MSSEKQLALQLVHLN